MLYLTGLSWCISQIWKVSSTNDVNCPHPNCEIPYHSSGYRHKLLPDYYFSRKEAICRQSRKQFQAIEVKNYKYDIFKLFSFIFSARRLGSECHSIRPIFYIKKKLNRRKQFKSLYFALRCFPRIIWTTRYFGKIWPAIILSNFIHFL